MTTMEILTFCLVLFAFGNLLLSLITLIMRIIQLMNKKIGYPPFRQRLQDSLFQLGNQMTLTSVFD